MRSVSPIAAAGHAEVGGARRSRAARSISGRTRLARRGDVADAGQRAQLLLDRARGVAASARRILAGEHQHVLLAEPPRPTLMRAPGNGVQRVADLLLDRLLAMPLRCAACSGWSASPALRASAAPPRRERVAAGAPPPMVV